MMITQITRYYITLITILEGVILRVSELAFLRNIYIHSYDNPDRGADVVQGRHMSSAGGDVTRCTWVGYPW